jgi:hypothetical protein
MAQYILNCPILPILKKNDQEIAQDSKIPGYATDHERTIIHSFI